MLSSRSEMIRGGGGLLEVFNVILFQFLGLTWAKRYLGRGLRFKYEGSCMMCCGAWARGIRVQGSKPCIRGLIRVQ